MTSHLHKASRKVSHKAFALTAALLLSASGLMPPALAQEQSTEEQLKSISIICAGIYQVQIDTNGGTPDAAAKRDQMRQVYVALASISDTEATQQISAFTQPLKDIKTNDPAKWSQYLNLCEELSKPSGT